MMSEYCFDISFPITFLRECLQVGCNIQTSEVKTESKSQEFKWRGEMCTSTSIPSKAKGCSAVSETKHPPCKIISHLSSRQDLFCIKVISKSSLFNSDQTYRYHCSLYNIKSLSDVNRVVGKWSATDQENETSQQHAAHDTSHYDISMLQQQSFACNLSENIVKGTDQTGELNVDVNNSCRQTVPCDDLESRVQDNYNVEIYKEIACVPNENCELDHDSDKNVSGSSIHLSTVPKQLRYSSGESTKDSNSSVFEMRVEEKTLMKPESVPEIHGNCIHSPTGKMCKYGLRGVKLSKKIMDLEKGVSPKKQNTLLIDENVNHDEQSYKESDNRKVSSIKRKKNIEVGSNNLPKFKRRKRNNVRKCRCEYCERLFCDYTGVSEHIKKFHSNKNGVDEYLERLKLLQEVQCCICQETFPTRYALQYHEDIAHLKAQEVKCPICEKIFGNIFYVKNHIRAVHNTEQKAHLCHLCPAKFKQSGSLKQHIAEIHDGLKQVLCKICGKEFSTKSQLKRHQRIHGLDESKRQSCEICGKEFWFENNLKRHINTVHTVHKESFHCSYCGKGFHQKNGMLSHVQIQHFNLFSFSCSICNAGFFRSKHLKDHMLNVHGQKGYNVKENKRERYKYNRSAEELYYCSYCSDSFYFKAKLVEHMHQSHANVFPFICETCDQGFLKSEFLETHLLKAHDIETADKVENEDSLLGKNVTEMVSQIFSRTIHKQIIQKDTENIYVEQDRVAFDDTDKIQQDRSQGALQTVNSQELLKDKSEPLLVQLETDNNTYYVIQQPPQDGSSGCTSNLQDIANIVFAAEESLQTNHDEASDLVLPLNDHLTNSVTPESTVELPDTPLAVESDSTLLADALMGVENIDI